MRLKLSKTDWLIFASGLLVFLYIFVKASISSFTTDESFSYLHYAHTSFLDIISFSDWYTNNHILNSLLMKYAEVLFGSSEISLRLPNILLFVVYMVYSFLLFRDSDRLVVLAVFILLCTNPGMVDLFGLARGYGLSYGFLLMSLFHFIRYFQNRKSKDIVFFHIASMLAVLSSFTMLISYAALMVIYFITDFISNRVFLKKKYSFFKSVKVHIIPVVLIAIILYEPVRRVFMRSELNFGGKEGFYSNTVSDLIKNLFHGIEISPAWMIVAQIIITAVVLAGSVIIARMFFKKDDRSFFQHTGLFITNLLIIFISLAILFQHLILGTDYPIARFSLFLFPVFIVYFGFLLSYLSEKNKNLVVVSGLCLALLSAGRFVYKADLRSCSEWRFDMETKNMIRMVSDDHDATKAETVDVRLGINWLFEPTVNFYRETLQLDWLLPVDRRGFTAEDDYIYTFRDELTGFPNDKYEVVHEFESVNTVLIKRLEKTTQ